MLVSNQPLSVRITGFPILACFPVYHKPQIDNIRPRTHMGMDEAKPAISPVLRHLLEEPKTFVWIVVEGGVEVENVGAVLFRRKHLTVR